MQVKHPTLNGREMSLEVFRELFDKYRESLIMEAREILHDVSEAEDVVQDTFIAIWEKKHLANVHAAAHRTYLFNAVRNNSLGRKAVLETAMRRKSRYLETAPGSEVADQGAVWELRERLNEAIQQLPEQRRLAFTRSHLDNKSYKEVSEEMGLGLETVRTHVKIALRQMRTKLLNMRMF